MRSVELEYVVYQFVLYSESNVFLVFSPLLLFQVLISVLPPPPGAETALSNSADQPTRIISLNATLNLKLLLFCSGTDLSTLLQTVEKYTLRWGQFLCQSNHHVFFHPSR